jgi:hypothetical protein
MYAYAQLSCCYYRARASCKGVLEHDIICAAGRASSILFSLHILEHQLIYAYVAQECHILLCSNGVLLNLIKQTTKLAQM